MSAGAAVDPLSATSGSAYLAFVPPDDGFDFHFTAEVKTRDPRDAVFRHDAITQEPWMFKFGSKPRARHLSGAIDSVDAAIDELVALSLSRRFRVDVMERSENFDGYALELEAMLKRDEARRIGQSRETAAEELRAKHMSIGVKKFNSKPKHGIEYLEQHGLLDHTAAAHAAFLRNTPGLYKTMIGEYLGQPEAFFLDVLRAFVSSFDFCAFDVDHALREFLSTFRLPGEAQKIDRMMEAFAQRYHAHNPDVFSHADTVYVLSFALIMLNTDAHSPQVKNKMSLEQFFATTRGIDCGQDIDPILLERLYRSICDNEITMEPDCQPSAFDSADKEGFLRKQGGRIKTWKRRWFLLSGGCLYYFAKQSERAAKAVPKGIVPLENVTVSPVAGSQTQFEITSSSGEAMKAAKLTKSAMTESRHEKFVLEAKTTAERDEWLTAIARHIVSDPYFELLRLKREALQQEISAHGGGRKGASAAMARRKAASEMRHSANISAAVDDVHRDSAARRRTATLDQSGSASGSAAAGSPASGGLRTG